MLLTYCAVKVMEILNRKWSFPDQPEISVLRHSFFLWCFEQGSNLHFFSAVSFSHYPL